ncbi:MAG: hypothetical protein GC184_12370 [Rhizobiales bacterium]|nr:hypothetical protein [Hyphomicrobiales bacterium]
MKPHFESQPAVDSYGNMGFRLAGQLFPNGVIITPLGLYPWGVTRMRDAMPSDFERLLAAADHFDVCVIGCGETIEQFPKETRDFLLENRIAADLMNTASACRTYNFLLSEGRRVAAALIPVE